jgi:Tfp pilus assembly protein PilE
MRPKFQISNFKFQIKRGFTLAETVVFVGSFAVLAIIATATLFMVLGNVAKTRINQEIRRNGDNALQIMERHLKVAKEIVSCTTTAVTFFDQYGSKDASGGPTGSFSCGAAPGYTGVLALSSASGQLLTDPSRVTISNCAIFNCDSPSDPEAPKKWVKIDFGLTSAGTSARTTEKTTVQWHSQVNIRYQ